jgi:hypothetical protein
MTTTRTYRGEDRSVVLSDKQRKLAVKAILDATPYAREMTWNQCHRAVSADTHFDPAGENAFVEEGLLSKTLVAALIVAEYDLHLLNSPTGTEAANVQGRVHHALRGCGYRLLERGGNRGWKPYDIWVFNRNDSEDFDSFDDLAKGGASIIEAVESVHFFDRTREVHLCEVTPSRELYFVTARVLTINADLSDEDEAVRDEAEDALRGTYNPVEYTHVSDMERYIEENWERVYHYGNPGLDLNEIEEEVGQDDDDDEQRIYERVMHRVLEHLSGNEVI